MSSRDKRKWIHKSYFNILEKIGYTTKSSSCDDAISQLTFFSAFCILLPVFVGLLANIPSINSQLLQWVSIAVSIGVSFDMIKEVISKEIKALEKQFPEHGQVSALEEQLNSLKLKNNSLEENSDSKVREYLLRLNLVRLNEAAPNLIEQIIFKNLALNKSRTNFHSMPLFLSDAEEDYTSGEIRKNLGAVIRTIKKDSWNRLAKNAALSALNPNLDDIAYGPDYIAYGKPGHPLFKDIFIYLYAWLVNSIDNSIPIDTFYTPIDDIGLRYPSEQSPDIEKYRKSFEFLVLAFDDGDFYKFIKDIQSTSPEQSLSIEQIEICKTRVPFYLKKLIKMLDDFESRPRR